MEVRGGGKERPPGAPHEAAAGEPQRKASGRKGGPNICTCLYKSNTYEHK
jgi:hypothetical protein